MDLEVGRNVALDVIQELTELCAAMAPVALSDDLACGDVKGGEQRGSAIALLVMGAPLDLAGTQRQQGLGAIEGHRTPIVFAPSNVKDYALGTSSVLDLI